MRHHDLLLRSKTQAQEFVLQNHFNLLDGHAIGAFIKGGELCLFSSKVCAFKFARVQGSGVFKFE